MCRTPSFEPVIPFSFFLPFFAPFFLLSAMRQMHPFPIFERFLTKDLVVEENSVSTTTSTSTASPSSTQQSSGCPFSMSYFSKNSNKNIDDCDSNSSEIDDNRTSNPHIPLLHPMKLKQPSLHSSPSITNNNDNAPIPVPVPVPVPHGISGSGVRVLIKANTQVVMFPSDWRDHKSWPVFGAGKRSCPGRSQESICNYVCNYVWQILRLYIFKVKHG